MKKKENTLTASLAGNLVIIPLATVVRQVWVALVGEYILLSGGYMRSAKILCLP